MFVAWLSTAKCKVKSEMCKVVVMDFAASVACLRIFEKWKANNFAVFIANALFQASAFLNDDFDAESQPKV